MNPIDPTPAPRRRGNPNMIKGAPSVNPSGRPRGAAGLARFIAERTDDGRELVDRLLEIARDPDGGLRDRTAAIMALLDRLAGKPMQDTRALVLTASMEGPTTTPPDWDALPRAQREAWIDAIVAGARADLAPVDVAAAVADIAGESDADTDEEL